MSAISGYPYRSTKNHALAGIWYPNTVNFPACKLLLHHDDYTSGNDWIDRIGGVIFRNTTGWTKDSSGMMINGAGTASTVGTLPAFGTKHFVLFVVATFSANTSKWVVGNEAAGSAISISGGTLSYITRDITANYLQSAVLASTAPTYPTTGCMTQYADVAANEARKTYANAAGTEFASALKGAGSAGTIAGTWGALETGFAFPGVAGNQTKMLAIFAFTNIPSAAEIVIATRWMAANPGKLYPRWAGVT